VIRTPGWRTSGIGPAAVSHSHPSAFAQNELPQAGAAVAGWTEEEIMDGVGVAGLEVAAVL